MSINKQLKEGDRVPDVVFKTRVGDSPVCGGSDGCWQDVTTEEIFSGKKVVVFALPGAYTPMCSSAHLPGYEEQYSALKTCGVDDVYCLSVNDAFVMQQWARDLRCPHVKLLPDGNGDFTTGMGMMVTKNNLGFGNRSWRYSVLVEDGIIKKIFSEAGFSDECATDPFEVSDAETMVAHIKENI
ncbi:MAG: peroxiredoxin [Candidatus Paceibacterota bacterium]|jgi:peroxiredoxin